MGFAEVGVLLAVVDDGVQRHVVDGIVADVDGAVEELPVVVEASIVGRVAIEAGGGDVVGVERLLLVVVAEVEDVGTHLRETQTGLLAPPSA